MYFSIKAALAAVGAALALSFAGTAAAQGTIKIAYTDPLSGPFAQVGDANLKQMNFIIDFINSLRLRSLRVKSATVRSNDSRSKFTKLDCDNLSRNAAFAMPRSNSL